MDGVHTLDPKNHDQAGHFERRQYVLVGDKDFALEGWKKLSAVLNKHGIRHQLHVSGGGRAWDQLAQISE